MPPPHALLARPPASGRRHAAARGQCARRSRRPRRVFVAHQRVISGGPQTRVSPPSPPQRASHRRLVAVPHCPGGRGRGGGGASGPGGPGHSPNAVHVGPAAPPPPPKAGGAGGTGPGRGRHSAFRGTAPPKSGAHCPGWPRLRGPVRGPGHAPAPSLCPGVSLGAWLGCGPRACVARAPSGQARVSLDQRAMRCPVVPLRSIPRQDHVGHASCGTVLRQRRSDTPSH